MSNQTTTQSPLFIFEMANNHQGSLEHGLNIVAEMGRIAQRHNIRAAVKYQYRDIDTFIHPDFVDRDDVKHIPRFLSTRLKREEFQSLVMATKEAGMLAVVTPFDEVSVGHCIDHGVDIIKVASCSANDWPLLEEIAGCGKPIICSTGGCRLADIDKIVTFFEHRNVEDLSILHCVGIYPTEDSNQNLRFLQRMIRRYPHCQIGFSGHESPENHGPGQAAAAMGAQIFERHVGLPTDTIKLNAYSMSPEETSAWVGSVLSTLEICGPVSDDKPITESEAQSLLSLKRGVFAKENISKGETLTRDKVFFAMPCDPDQMSTDHWQDGLVASADYEANGRVMEKRPFDPVQVMRGVVHEAKGFLREAGISLGSEYEIELSHHYGMEKFRRYGAIIINFFNREYCKKIIILLPGQQHPSHAHTKKEETFQILYGDMKLTLDGETNTMRAGDIQLVQRGQYHSFSTRGGVIFEEISTTHIKSDSDYEDKTIASLDPVRRKSVITSW